MANRYCRNFRAPVITFPTYPDPTLLTAQDKPTDSEKGAVRCVEEPAVNKTVCFFFYRKGRELEEEVKEDEEKMKTDLQFIY